jgi:hypothetical protein
MMTTVEAFEDGAVKMSHKKPTAALTNHQVLAVAVQAEVDPKSVRRFIDGKPGHDIAPEGCPRRSRLGRWTTSTKQ